MFWVQNINYEYFYLQLLTVLQYSSAQYKITRGVWVFFVFVYTGFIYAIYFSVNCFACQ